MPVSADWNELLHAFEFAGLGEPHEHEAVLGRKTGKFLWQIDLEEDIEAWPDDADDEEKYLSIPHKKELDVGKPLVFEFARQFLPDEFNEVRRIFDEGCLCAVQRSPATKKSSRSMLRFRGQGN